MGGGVNNNSINVYKQLIEKERKHHQDERARKEVFLNDIQSKVLNQSNQIES